MTKNLVDITPEEISLSAERCIEEETLIMYLKNRGNKKDNWKIEDIDAWIDEDIDEQYLKFYFMLID